MSVECNGAILFPRPISPSFAPVDHNAVAVLEKPFRSIQLIDYLIST